MVFLPETEHFHFGTKGYHAKAYLKGSRMNFSFTAPSTKYVYITSSSSLFSHFHYKFKAHPLSWVTLDHKTPSPAAASHTSWHRPSPCSQPPSAHTHTHTHTHTGGKHFILATTVTVDSLIHVHVLCIAYCTYTHTHTQGENASYVATAGPLSVRVSEIPLCMYCHMHGGGLYLLSQGAGIPHVIIVLSL